MGKSQGGSHTQCPTQMQTSEPTVAGSHVPGLPRGSKQLAPQGKHCAGGTFGTQVQTPVAVSSRHVPALPAVSAQGLLHGHPVVGVGVGTGVARTQTHVPGTPVVDRHVPSLPAASMHGLSHGHSGVGVGVGGTGRHLQTPEVSPGGCLQIPWFPSGSWPSSQWRSW